MVEIEERFLAVLAGLPLDRGDGVLLAVSGGGDSLALAELFHATRERHGAELTIGHVDHGIHPASAGVAERVARYARDRGLPFASRSLGLGPDAGETRARSARYAALADLRRAAGLRWIATAHHADDQAETVLMRVLHGTGPAGLAAMRAVSGAVLRPLLGMRRGELEAYVAGRGLEPWRDPANADPRHERAWFRATIMPGLETRFPDAVLRLARTATQAAADRDAWDALLDELPGLDVARSGDGVSVAAHRLAGYDSRLAPALLRALARRAGIRLGARATRRALELVRAGRSGASTPLGQGARAELAFGRLLLHRTPPAPEAGAVALTGAAGSASFGGWQLRWRRDRAPAAAARNATSAWFVLDADLRVRGWRAGDRIYPVGGTGRRLLVRCFQDARVPRSRRAGWPVVEAGGQVLWVPGVTRARELVPEEGSEAVRVDVAYP